MSKKKFKIKVDDLVQVMTGKDRGKQGKVLQVLAEREMVVVDGVNAMIKHLKSPRRDEQGQRVDFFGPVHISNVMLVDPKTKKPTRVSMEVVKGEDGKTQKIRKSKKSNEVI